MSWLLRRKTFPEPKRIDLKNILNYAKAEVRHWQSTTDFIKCPKHIEEQSLYRLEQIRIKSPGCFEKGFCRLCGCDIVEKSFEDSDCRICYPKMMDEKTWNTFKKQNNIR